MPSAGDNLSLGKLGRAVGANSNDITETALGDDGRGVQDIETKMSDFDASTLSSMTINPDQAKSGTFLATMNFSSYGSLFLTRIADRDENFTWSETSDLYNQVYIDSGTEDYTATWNIYANDPETGETTNIRGKYHDDGQSDGFNDHVTNYSQNLTDVFTYNSPD